VASNPIARSLVDAAAAALSSTYDDSGIVTEWLPIARPTVVAVLRALAATGDDWRPEELDALADEIEGDHDG
jgi:hypothetical protein